MSDEAETAGEPGRARFWVAVAAICVFLAPAAGIAASGASGGRALGLVVAQCVLTVCAFLIPQVRQLRAEQREVSAEAREVEARTDARVAINDALEPIVTLLGNLALEPSTSERELLKEKAVTLVLTTASTLIGPERSRACWFRLEGGPPTRLVPTEHVGRAGSATTEFVEGTPGGDAAIDMILADQDRLCEDIEESPPPGWDTGKVRDYRTFISVSVIAGDTAYGMLTLDALEPGDLTTEDMGLLRLMAGVLAAALSIS